METEYLKRIRTLFLVVNSTPHNLPFVSAPSDKRVQYASRNIIVAEKIKMFEENLPHKL